MRVDTIGTSPVTPPEVRPDVGATRAVAPVSAQTLRREVRAVPGSAPREEALQAPATSERPGDQRRGDERRGDERRKRQLPVLIDTRVGQRRRGRRRTADAAPTNIDTQA
jgi:hypothetical protein